MLPLINNQRKTGKIFAYQFFSFCNFDYLVHDMHLGLIREGEGIAAGVLDSMGVELEQARQETIRLLKEQ